MSAFRKSIAAALLAAMASLFFFSPRLLVFTEQAPGSYEWTRGLNFLAQVQGQSMEKVEPALRHRLLPVYAARALGLDGYGVFALGWAGVVVLLACVYGTMLRLGLPPKAATATTFLFASTSAVITSFGWLGIFDSWWVCALVVAAFDSRLMVVGAATLLAPWIDERFIFALPVAFMSRWLVFRWGAKDVLKVALTLGLAVLPYAVWRIYSLFRLPGDASGEFISSSAVLFVVWLRLVPHGWWMAYRLAWIFALIPFFLPNASGVRRGQIFAACLVAASAATITAADISRSAMLLAPLVPAGVVIAWREAPETTGRWLPVVAAANFLVPYVHVVYNKLEAVHPLPWEIIRLIKKLGSP